MTEFNINFQPRYTFIEAIEKLSTIYTKECHSCHYMIICEDDVENFLTKDKNINRRLVGLTVVPHRTPDGIVNDLVQGIISYNPLADTSEFFTMKTNFLTLENIAQKWTVPITVADLMQYMNFLRENSSSFN